MNYIQVPKRWWFLLKLHLLRLQPYKWNFGDHFICLLQILGLVPGQLFQIYEKMGVYLSRGRGGGGLFNFSQIVARHGHFLIHHLHVNNNIQ